MVAPFIKASGIGILAVLCGLKINNHVSTFFSVVSQLLYFTRRLTLL